MPGDHDFKKKKKELKEKLAKINDDNTRGDVDVDKNEQYKSVATNEYYNKHDADMGWYNKDKLDKVQQKNQKKGKKVPQKRRETPTKENNYQTHMDSKGAFEQRALKEKVKKAELTDITKEQKKKKGKEKLIHQAGKRKTKRKDIEVDQETDSVYHKGFDITNREGDSAKGRMYGPNAKPISDKTIDVGNKILQRTRKARGMGVIPTYSKSKVKKTPPQGPSGGTAETPEAIIKDAEAVARKNDTYIGQLKQKIAEKRKRDYQQF